MTIAVDPNVVLFFLSIGMASALASMLHHDHQNPGAAARRVGLTVAVPLGVGWIAYLFWVLVPGDRSGWATMFFLALSVCVLVLLMSAATVASVASHWALKNQKSRSVHLIVTVCGAYTGTLLGWLLLGWWSGRRRAITRVAAMGRPHAACVRATGRSNACHCPICRL